MLFRSLLKHKMTRYSKNFGGDWSFVLAAKSNKVPRCRGDGAGSVLGGLAPRKPGLWDPNIQ